jgi:hypothetical protein
VTQAFRPRVFVGRLREIAAFFGTLRRVSNDNASSQIQPSASPLLWAMFLGVSWTWVIGMFLPVLLVRDYGMLGWIVFAVPNVIGAAAMGWVLRDADASRRFVRRHAGACFEFSLVTIAYHVFFAVWMINRLHSGWGWAALGVYAIAAVLPGRDVVRFSGAALALFTSLSMWWLLYRQESALTLPTMRSALSTAHPWSGLLLMLPFIIGFGLCPYLDLTFHRARQNTSPSGGRLAFGAGFGVVFFAMIVFTLLYARFLRPAVDAKPVGQVSGLFVCLHLVGQSAFTIAAHVKELPGRSAFVIPSAFRFAATAAAIVLLGAIAIGWLASDGSVRFRGRDFGEAVYWCFLGFYGIVFPAYLLLQGFGEREASLARVLRIRWVLPLVVVVTLPMYWVGLVEHRPMWLIPAVLILVGSRALMPARPTANS